MHQPPQQQHQGDLMQQQPPSRAYGHYINSNPSSTHSSPRSFAADLDGFYPTMQAHANHTITHSQTYPLPAGATINPYLPAQQRRPQLPNMQQSRSTSYSSYTAPALQVSTSTSSVHEHDPNERTARPGNAHAHTQFHSALEAGAASSGSASTSNSNSTTSSASNAANGDQQSQNDYTSSTPGLSQGLSRPLKPIEQERLAHLDRLKFFLATAPSRWDSAAANANPPPSGFSGVGGGDFGSSFGSGPGGYGTSGVFPGMGLGLEPAYHHAPPHPALNRFLLPNQEFVTCVLWNGLYHITGTDIVRALVFRFEAFGRPVRNMKKFEEGVFSDLRNLKPGVDACLEEPKSPFLDLLFKYQCIRTQKKQKVFYWFSVPHDRLFLDALERDLKREKMGQEPTTEIVGEPALSFTYDPKRSLYEQFSKAQGVRDGESELEAAIRNHDEANESGGDNAAESGGDTNMTDDSEHDGGDESGAGGDESDAGGGGPAQRRSTAAKRASGNLALGPNGQPIFQMLSLFTGSPTYKQRRKKGTKASSLRKGSEDYAADGEYDRGRSMDGGSGRFSSLSRERRVHMPMHGSMMEEFGPGSAAEKARQADEMSAAEMFLKQARGQLVPGDGVVRKPRPQNVVGEVGVYYHDPATHDQVGSVQRMHGHMRGKSYDERDPNSEQSRPPAPMSAGLATRSFADAQAQAQGLTNISPYEAVSADGKTRAFVCPLYSCSRLFKRMEHLKRHMRTHTMERPFPCPRCNKNFSRSDNLTQHLRTHERTGHGPQVPGGDPGAQGWDSESGNEGSTNEDSPGHGNISESDDDVSGMMGFGQNQAMTGLEPMFSGVGIGNMDLSGFGGMLSGNVDMQHDSDFASMCEVEIPGGVRDVPGNEGELVPMGDSSLIYRPGMVQQSDEYFSSLPSSATTSGLLFSSTDSTSADLGDNSQWAARPQSSMAFSSNQPGARGLHQMRSFHGHHSSSLSQSSNISEDFLAASLSAPSHKQSFEHAALYPPGLLDNPVASGVGPVRRHRSMTPSIARNGEPIRRPMTANNELQGVGGGSPASVSSLSSNRGYHPYAGYSNSNSRANSTHNSPQVVSVSLGDHHRSESRNSSYGGLHEQMRQMMNVDSGNNVDGPASLFPSDSMFRTGSPASFHQTESPGTFSVDLPTTSNMYPGAPGFMHAATMPVGSQYGQQQQQQQFEGNFYQHNNTL